MKRPAFQFYTADWRNNAKLRRCSPAARGVWVDVLCVLHDSDEYGICRWPLADLANAAGASIKLVRELVDKDVLKGADKHAAPYVYTPRHAGKDGAPVTLVTPGDGACWYSSRFVRDEWVRLRRGSETRFESTNLPPVEPPKASPKPPIGEPEGDGSTYSSSSSSSEKEKGARKRSPSFDASRVELPDWLDAELWAEWVKDRADRGKRITEAGAKQQLATLDEFRRLGHSPERTIRHAISSGNQGLFPPPKLIGADVARMTVPAGKPSTYLADQAEHARLAEIDRLARLARKAQAA